MSVVESRRNLLALLASKYNWKSNVAMSSIKVVPSEYSPPATVTRNRGNTTTKKKKAKSYTLSPLSPGMFDDSLSPQPVMQMQSLSNSGTPINMSPMSISPTSPIYVQECNTNSNININTALVYGDKENVSPIINNNSNNTNTNTNDNHNTDMHGDGLSFTKHIESDGNDEKSDEENEFEWHSGDDLVDSDLEGSDVGSESGSDDGDDRFIVLDSTDESEHGFGDASDTDSDIEYQAPTTPKSRPNPTSTSTPQPLQNISSKRSRQSLSSMKSFSRQRVKLGTDMYTQYNQLVFKGQLPPDLPIVWSKTLLTTAGRAWSTPKTRTASKIELSIKVVDTPARLKDTLLHEMCHIAVNTIGFYCPNVKPHGAEFFRWANKVNFHVPGAVTGACHSYDIHKPHKFSCVNDTCGVAFYRHSKKGLDIEG